jgi:hypothetical protein
MQVTLTTRSRIFMTNVGPALFFFVGTACGRTKLPEPTGAVVLIVCVSVWCGLVLWLLAKEIRNDADKLV